MPDKIAFATGSLGGTNLQNSKTPRSESNGPQASSGVFPIYTICTFYTATQLLGAQDLGDRGRLGETALPTINYQLSNFWYNTRHEDQGHTGAGTGIRLV